MGLFIIDAFKQLETAKKNLFQPFVIHFRLSIKSIRKNMKNQFLMATALVFGLAVSSCKKDQLTDATNQVITDLAVDETVDAVVDSLGDFMENPIITDATEQQDLEIMSVPEILDTDYFVFVETRGGRKDSMVKSCSDVLKLSRDNKEALAKLYRAKIECMKANREVLSRVDEKLRGEAMEMRRGLMEKHKAEVDAIMKAFRAGDITEKERDAKMMEAKKNLTAGLMKIRAGVREKIKSAKDRLEAAGKIKNCEREYLSGVVEIIGKENYAKWVRCHKMHMRKWKK